MARVECRGLSTTTLAWLQTLSDVICKSLRAVTHPRKLSGSTARPPAQPNVQPPTLPSQQRQDDRAVDCDDGHDTHDHAGLRIPWQHRPQSTQQLPRPGYTLKLRQQSTTCFRFLPRRQHPPLTSHAHHHGPIHGMARPPRHRSRQSAAAVLLRRQQSFLETINNPYRSW
jgi:hypothetical protein